MLLARVALLLLVAEIVVSNEEENVVETDSSKEAELTPTTQKTVTVNPTFGLLVSATELDVLEIGDDVTTSLLMYLNGTEENDDPWSNVITAIGSLINHDKVKSYREQKFVKSCVTAAHRIMPRFRKILRDLKFLKQETGTSGAKLQADCEAEVGLDATSTRKALEDVSVRFNNSMDAITIPETGTEISDTIYKQIAGALCAAAQSYHGILDQLSDEVTQIVILVTNILRKNIPDLAYTLLAHAACNNDNHFDSLALKSCYKVVQGMQCIFTVPPTVKEHKVKLLQPVPFMVNDRAIEVDFPEKKLIQREHKSLYADASKCTREHLQLRCKKNLEWKASDCFEHVIGNTPAVDEIISTCKFRRAQMDDTPLITEVELGVLVAQRSPQSVAIAKGDEIITADPVILSTAHSIHVQYGTTEVTVHPSTQVEQEQVLNFRYNHSSKEVFYDMAHPLETYSSELLPSNYQEGLLLLSLFLQICLVIPCMIGLIKYIRKGGGGDNERKNQTQNRRWSRKLPLKKKKKGKFEESPMRELPKTPRQADDSNEKLTKYATRQLGILRQKKQTPDKK